MCYTTPPSTAASSSGYSRFTFESVSGRQYCLKLSINKLNWKKRHRPVNSLLCLSRVRYLTELTEEARSVRWLRVGVVESGPGGCQANFHCLHVVFHVRNLGWS